MDDSFEAFIALNTNRTTYIDDWLTYHHIPHSLITLTDKKHIVVRFSPNHYDPRFRQKTLVAHHDRVPGSPGANDNSAACYQLLQFAKELNTFAPFGGQSYAHNIRILFTDGEEAAGTHGIHGQGSYRLGKGLHQIGFPPDDIFVFDATGCGDTLVISTTGITNSDDTPLTMELFNLHKKTIEIAQKISPENWIRLVTPFSDNAGLLSAGIPAQVITILPHQEATSLLYTLNRGTELEKNQRKAVIMANSSSGKNEILDDYIPPTWSRMHTSADTAKTLTKEAFYLIHNFLGELAKRQDLIY